VPCVSDSPKRRRSPFAPAAEDPLVERAVPVSKRLGDYKPKSGRADLIAGLTVAAVALPSGMAYAEVAGLEPVRGLYALLIPSVAYALLGSSRQVIVGPEGSLAALIAAAVLPLAAAASPGTAGLAATLCLMVGALFILARVVRLAWIADYLSRPVLVGYIHGVAAVLIIGQLGKLLGVDVEELDPIPQLAEVFRELPDASTATMVVSGVALTALLALRAVSPRFPAALVVVVAAIVASAALDLADDGVAVVGAVPAGLPDISLPGTSFGDITTLIPAAIGLFLVTLADGILTARAYAGKRNESIDASQELVALGVANATAGISQGMPVGVSGSRTALNDSLRAPSQIAGMIAAAAIALILLFLTDPIGDLPKAVLGAAIVAAAIGLIDLAGWRTLRRTDSVEFAIAAVTTAGVLITGVLEAIVLAVGLSVVDVVRRSARPHDAVLGWVPELERYGDVSVNRSAKVTPGVVVYRVDDRIFFANAGYVKGRVREAVRGARGRTHTVVFDAEALTHADSAGVAALRELATTLAEDDITLTIARAKSRVEDRLRDLLEVELPADRWYPTVRAAVEARSGSTPPS